ncbi:ATP-dependent DNA helicase PIF1, partial [Nosema granulosis]
TSETVPCRLWIKFNEEKTGRKARANFHNVMRNRNMDPSLTPIEPVTRQINTRSTNFKVERKQFPVVPCEAMTIYKSQGGTYEKVVVNLKKGMTRSELYVACSRATKASGLYLVGDFVPPKPPERNDAVAMMFKTMRSERMLKFSLDFPEESQGERVFVMFHNVQSLNKHILDIRSDNTFLCASMISLVETWTKPTDSLEIEGFKVIHRRDCNEIRKPFGQITYLKNDLKYENITERCEYSGKDHIEYCSIKVDDTCIISVYNSPNSPYDVLKRNINEVISVSKRFCKDIIVVGDFNINLKIKTNHKFIEYMESFGLSLVNKLDKSSTNAKTRIDYCFANMNDLKSDYFESLTSFHKPIWIRKHGVLTEFHVDEIEQVRTDVTFNLEDLKIYDQSDFMEVDEEFSFDRYEIVDENEQVDIDTNFNFEDLHTNDQSNVMEIDEQSSLENYEIIDLTSRNILDHFLLLLDSDNIIDSDQTSSQAHIINDLIEKSPFITVDNRDQSIRLKSKTEYSVQAFDLVYARTRTTADGNCLYSSLSILNIGSEKLTHSMRLLAVNAMINNRDYFQILCTLLNYSYEEQLKRTARNTVWGGEVQIQALSIALSHPIYSYTNFNSDPKNRHYISLNISLQELVSRFSEGTAGGHLKYIGYKSDKHKLAFCIYYNGTHYDALLPFENNPQQFVPHFDIINMSL